MPPGCNRAKLASGEGLGLGKQTRAWRAQGSGKKTPKNWRALKQAAPAANNPVKAPLSLTAQSVQAAAAAAAAAYKYHCR